MTARDDAPSIHEIAELTGRLRRLSAAGRDADAAERAAFLADKAALLARIPDSAAEPGRVLHPHVLPPVPTEMLDGIEQRRTEPAQPDDPAELEARLTELRERVAVASGTPAGGWQTVGREQAARDLAGRGVDLDTARRMVSDYLRETSERVEAPAYEWGLDQGDVDAMAAEHQLPATLAPAAALAVVDQDAAQVRAEQLNRWYADDHAQDGAGDTADETGWSR